MHCAQTLTKMEASDEYALWLKPRKGENVCFCFFQIRRQFKVFAFENSLI